MLYQLPNGRTIQMSIETFLNLSDEDLRDLSNCSYGREINNPLFNSSIIEEKEEEIIEDFYLVKDDSIDIIDLLSEEEPPLDLED